MKGLNFVDRKIKRFPGKRCIIFLDPSTIIILTCIVQFGWGSVQYVHWRILHGHTLFSCWVRCLLWTFSWQFLLAHATCWKGQDSKWIYSTNKTKTTLVWVLAPCSPWEVKNDQAHRLHVLASSGSNLSYICGFVNSTDENNNLCW